MLTRRIVPHGRHTLNTFHFSQNVNCDCKVMRSIRLPAYLNGARQRSGERDENTLIELHKISASVRANRWIFISFTAPLPRSSGHSHDE